MRALVQDRYGPPEALHLAGVKTPEPGPEEVLVRVHAASLNPRDWHLMRGEPRIARLLDRRTFGRRAPREPVRGTDFAGVVEAVGAGVTRCRPGDAVFGEAPAALAELVVAPEQHVAAVPPRLSFELAAALPLAANTALTCLDAAEAAPRETLLVNGAAGGVGTFLVQMAAARGMHVTAVCSASKADLVRSLGAHGVVDYRRQDFTRTGQSYDVVVDLVGNRALRELSRIVKRGGALVLSGGGVSGEGRYVGPVGLLMRAQLLRAFLQHRLEAPLALPSGRSLDEIAALVNAGVLTPVVDRVYPLEDGAKAVGYLETARARGKVVIAVSP